MRVDLLPLSGDGPAVIRKTAGTPAERHRLACEARLVAQAAHPGVVRLLGSSGGDLPDSLDYEAVPGQVLAELGPQSLQVAAGIGAALATTVADLHEVGVYHQAITPEHVLIDDRGRPVLCGLGRARAAGGEADPSEMRQKDVADIAAVVSALVPTSCPRPVTDVLARARRPRRSRAFRVPRALSARELARRIVELVPDAHLPGEATPAPGPGRPCRRRGGGGVGGGGVGGGGVGGDGRGRAKVVAIGVGALALLIATSVSASTASSGGRKGAAHPAAAWAGATGLRSVVTVPVACPAVDKGCGPISTTGPGATLIYGGSRFRLDADGQAEVMVMGRWACGTTALAAVLVPASGRVWVFRNWPGAGSSEEATLLATVPHASTMAVHPLPTGCDELTIDRSVGPAMTIDPRPAP